MELLLYTRIPAITNNHAVLCHQFLRGLSRNDSSCVPKERNKNENIPKLVRSIQLLHTSLME